MKPIVQRPLCHASFVFVLLAVVSCGDEPQRIGKSEPALPGPSMPPGHPPIAAAPKTVRLGGRVELTGTLAKVQSGAVFLIARNDGRTALVHRYGMNDPEWSTQGTDRVLEFSLTEQDNMGGAGAPPGAQMELEARYDPDGFVDAKQGTDKKGVVKAFTHAAVGDTKIALKLDPAGSAPSPKPPSPPSGKPGGG